MTIQQSVICPTCGRAFILETKTKTEILFRLTCGCPCDDHWSDSLKKAYEYRGVTWLWPNV